VEVESVNVREADRFAWSESLRVVVDS